MKKIIAYIRPEKLTDVKNALEARTISEFSVTNALGAGRQKGYTKKYRGNAIEANLLKKVRIEVAVVDAFVDKVIEGLIAGAQTGEIGDGKIFIQNLENAHRIRTKHEGKNALKSWVHKFS